MLRIVDWTRALLKRTRVENQKVVVVESPKGVAAFAVALIALDGACGGNASGTASPNPQLASIVSSPDPVQANNGSDLQGGCTPPSSSTTDDTPPTQWVFKYTNGQSNQGAMYWPKGNGSTPDTLQVYDDPQNQQVTFNTGQEAANFWEAQLNSGNPGTMLLGLQVDTTYSSTPSDPVQIFDTIDDYDNSHPAPIVAPETGVNVLTWESPTPGITGAYITLSPSYSEQETYDFALHELGHALGLNHSLYQWSVMYPLGSSCYSDSTTSMDVQDKSFLWNVYDPGWHPLNGVRPSPTPKPCPKCPPIEGEKRPSTVAFSGRMTRIVPRGHHVQPTISSYLLALEHATERSDIPNHPRALWHMVEDVDGSDSLTTDSMWLASSLVASGRVIGSIEQFSGDLYTTTYKAVQLSRIYKHLYSPDAFAKGGDVIIVATTTLPHGDEIREAPAISPADGNVMLFLRRNGGTTVYNGRRVPVYTTTSAFNGQYTIGARDELSPLGVRATFANRDIANRSISNALVELANGATTMKRVEWPGVQYNEELAVQRLLARNGYRTLSQLADYQREMFTSPGTFYARRALNDEQRHVRPLP